MCAPRLGEKRGAAMAAQHDAFRIELTHVNAW
jgi:hypothetical protein